MKLSFKIFFYLQFLFCPLFGQTLNLFDYSDLAIVKLKYHDNGEFRKEIEALKYLVEETVNEAPFTITKYKAPSAQNATINDYYSDSPYWWPVEGNPDLPYIRRDGERNPDRFMAHKDEVSKFYKGISALAFYCYFSEDLIYEEKINDLLNIWFINESTKMNPNLKYSQLIRNRTKPRGVGIIDGRRIALLTEAILLLKSNGKIDDKVYAGVKEWYTEYLDWLTNSLYGIDEKKRGNNHGTWWVVQISLLSSFLEAKDNISFINSHSKHYLLDNQIDSKARQPLEEERTRSLDYSVFNLTAHSLLCRSLSNYDIDNWHYINKNGKSLVDVIEYLILFIINPENWELKQINKFNNSKPMFLGIAGLDLKNKEYLEIYNRLSKYDEDDLNKPSFDPMQIILNAVVKMKLKEYK